MKSPYHLPRLFTFLLPLLLITACFSQEPPKPGPGMIEAAETVLSSLHAAQKDKAVFPFKDEERHNWHFTVKSRNGLPWEELDERQREKVIALLQTALSDTGYKKSREIMALETILSELEGRAPGNRFRHPELYYLSIFGTPSGEEPWGWRFEGHHLSLNFSSVEDSLAVTPAFFGSNPAEIPGGPEKGKRILKDEEDLARQLMDQLNPEQQKVAIISGRAMSMVTDADRKVKLQCCQGLAYAKMTGEQKEMLERLIHIYLDNMESHIAKTQWQKIQAQGIDQLHFAWAGSLEKGNQYYYRIQGPSFLVEYDATQGGGNHIHTVWRDTDSDFGEDLLKRHYEEHKH